MVNAVYLKLSRLNDEKTDGTDVTATVSRKTSEAVLSTLQAFAQGERACGILFHRFQEGGRTELAVSVRRHGNVSNRMNIPE